MLEKMFDMDEVWELVKEGFGEERDGVITCRSNGNMRRWVRRNGSSPL